MIRRPATSEALPARPARLSHREGALGEQPAVAVPGARAVARPRVPRVRPRHEPLAPPRVRPRRRDREARLGRPRAEDLAPPATHLEVVVPGVAPRAPA